MISGTRARVDLIIGKLAGGMAECEITCEDILAVLGHAARVLSSEEI